MTVLDHARKLVADCDEELHFERRVKRALKCLIAEIERLESELESIGAGGVGPLMPTAVQHQNEFNADNDLATKTSHSVTSGSTVPTGWKLVPVMPTSAMGASAVKYANGDDIYEKCTTTVLDIEAGIYEEIYRAMLAAAPQPPDSAYLLRDLATDLGVGEQVLMAAIRDANLGDYSINMALPAYVCVAMCRKFFAVPQPQVEQEPVAATLAFYEGEREPRLLSWNRLPNGEHRLYTHPQNLRCKSNQKRLATLWGYVKAEPLTDEQIMELFRGVWTDGTQAGPVTPMAIRVARAIERAVLEKAHG